MARTTQLTVTLENKVGMLAKLGKALRRAKVNIVAMSVADAADVCVIRLITSSAAKAAAALKKARMVVCKQPVVTAKLANKPGSLGAAAARLAKAKVNIDYVYGSTGAGKEAALIVFAVDNPAKAAKLLK